jgi:ribosomal protein L34E
VGASAAKLAANARYVKSPRGRVKAREWSLRYSRTPGAKLLRRSGVLRRKYGLTLSQWDEMFLAQGCCCKACGASDPGSRYNWKTDHDHATGRVRGILCHGCNIALGGVKDNPEVLKQLIVYLGAPRAET